mmetsp:Transcript_43521/g.105632  ORF Transcript_43521/g.105632 Transcript_43521/m.105632 type:complete len:298 (-) Transcript_43521:456-1349(-)
MEHVIKAIDSERVLRRPEAALPGLAFSSAAQAVRVVAAHGERGRAAKPAKLCHGGVHLHRADVDACGKRAGGARWPLQGSVARPHPLEGRAVSSQAEGGGAGHGQLRHAAVGEGGGRVVRGDVELIALPRHVVFGEAKQELPWRRAGGERRPSDADVAHDDGRRSEDERAACCGAVRGEGDRGRAEEGGGSERGHVVIVAAVVEGAGEELHAYDAEDQEDEGAEQHDRAHRRYGVEQRAHEHPHARDAVDRAQRSQQAHRTDGAHGVEPRLAGHRSYVNRHQAGDDDDEVEPVPRGA